MIRINYIPARILHITLIPQDYLLDLSTKSTPKADPSKPMETRGQENTGSIFNSIFDSKEGTEEK